MNEDELYVEISFNDYLELIDKSGYYKTYKSNVIRYYKNYQYHCLNGPAYIDKPNKFYVYFQNGKIHRLNGPAWIDEIENVHSYYINGKKYTKEEFDQHPKIIQYRLQKFQESICQK